MKKISGHISFKIITCILVLTLLVPSVVKFSHIFSHHHHEVCNGEPETHLHKADVDCNFYNFKLSTPFTIPVVKYEFTCAIDNHQFYNEAYSYLSEFQQLHFSLRGPPKINLV